MMPKNTAKCPDWSPYAETLIHRLRKLHGIKGPEENGEPSELDILFQKFEGPEPTERFAETAENSFRFVPARKLLSVIRIAAALKFPEIEQEAYRSGGIIVIDGIPVIDLPSIKDTVKEVFPARLNIVEPELVDGHLAKSAQTRFTRLISDYLDRMEPILILQTDGIKLPDVLGIMAPERCELAPITPDVLLKFLEFSHLSDQFHAAEDLRSALPPEGELRTQSTVDVCAALRTANLHDAIERLGRLVQRDKHGDGPRLEDMRGDGPALLAARRIVADLQAWKSGKASWNEISRSLLLHGAPGTGKTWLARAMSNSAGISLVTGSFGTWQAAGHLGDMLREMISSFAEARRKAPCLLVIDEIDAVGSRTDLDRHASNYRTQVITTFLTELDLIQQVEGVIVVGTCNYISRIDPAVIRPGRMDVKIEVLLPDADAIFEILQFHLSNDFAADDLRSLSHRAVGKSAAEIDAAIRAARSDARHRRKALSVEMLEMQLGLDPARENRARTWRVAVHEAGHAIVAQAVRIGDIDSIMIAERGGYVAVNLLPNEGLLADIEAQITYTMAGRAAEHLILGEVSSGAGGPAESDLALATRAAISIETTLGLGAQGPVWHQDSDAAHLAIPAVRDRVLKRLNRAETRASEILERNRHHLDVLARHLVEHRSAKAKTIARLLDGMASDRPEHLQNGLPP